MKKFLSFLFAFLLIISITACSAGTEGSSLTPPNAEKPDSEAPKAVTIPETVLLDSDGVKVTAKGLDTDSFMGPELKLLIENNSGKNLTFQARKVSVNGYMIDPIFSVDVADGKKANDALTLTQSELELCGISTIADIEFSLHLYDSDDWDVYLDTLAIQLKTSAAEGFIYTYDDSGTPAYEENGIKIIAKGISDDSIMGTDIILYLENNSDQSVTVQVRDMSVNGFMVDPIFSCEIEPGKHAIDGITILSSYLEENDITDIETVELSFHIYDSDSFMTRQDSDTITLTF